jgi:hypothetical protein
MIYRDLPIFVGTANQNPNTINNNYYLMASQVSIDMSAGGQAKRKINQSINQSDQFTHPNPLVCRVSFQSYIPGSDIEGFVIPDLSWAAKIIFTQATGDNYHAIKIGESIFDKCYLSNYTVSIDPFRPVQLTAEFICNDPPTGGGISEKINGVDSFIGSISFADNIIHGHTCNVSGANNIVSEIQSSIKYQVTCNRTPVYGIGSIMPSSMILDEIERQMDISSTDISSIINQEGAKLTSPVTVALKHSNSSITAYLNMNAGSKILSQKIQMQEGDSLMTEVSIKEFLV